VQLLQVDAVLEDMQQGGNIFADAGLQQRQHPLIVAQLGNVLHDELVDLRGYLIGAGGKRAGDVFGALRNGHASPVHRRVVRGWLCKCPVSRYGRVHISLLPIVRLQR